MVYLVRMKVSFLRKLVSTIATFDYCIRCDFQSIGLERKVLMAHEFTESDLSRKILLEFPIRRLEELKETRSE